MRTFNFKTVIGGNGYDIFPVYNLKITITWLNILFLLHNCAFKDIFGSHFLVQPLHVGFTGDLGGNSITVRWYRRKTNLHHVSVKNQILCYLIRLIALCNLTNLYWAFSLIVYSVYDWLRLNFFPFFHLLS